VTQEVRMVRMTSAGMHPRLDGPAAATLKPGLSAGPPWLAGVFAALDGLSNLTQNLAPACLAANAANRSLCLFPGVARLPITIPALNLVRV
jgi:hypothetical protein